MAIKSPYIKKTYFTITVTSIIQLFIIIYHEWNLLENKMVLPYFVHIE